MEESLCGAVQSPVVLQQQGLNPGVDRSCVSIDNIIAQTGITKIRFLFKEALLLFQTSSFHFTGHSPLIAVMENTTWPYPAYVPHYLLRGDPFASRLSREADFIAAFYICIIGEFPFQPTSTSALLSHFLSFHTLHTPLSKTI